MEVSGESDMFSYKISTSGLKANYSCIFLQIFSLYVMLVLLSEKTDFILKFFSM